MLVQAFDTTRDPTRGAPLRGDVIVIMPDGHGWGGAELEGRVVVKRPGQDARELARLLGNKRQHGCAPLFRACYIDLDTMEICRREPVLMEIS